MVLYENDHVWILWKNWNKLHRRGWARMNINLPIGQAVGKSSRIPIQGTQMSTHQNRREIPMLKNYT